MKQTQSLGVMASITVEPSPVTGLLRLTLRQSNTTTFQDLQIEQAGILAVMLELGSEKVHENSKKLLKERMSAAVGA